MASSSTDATESGTPVPEQPALSAEDARRGSIKTITCTPELAGQSVLPQAEMLPPPEAAHAMEGCLDLTAAKHPGHHAIELTIVYYLAPDGTVNETGVGADVLSVQAWEQLEPCAREYWRAYPPEVSPSTEKSFSCAYRWSEGSIAGGLGAMAGHVARVWSGREAEPFGASVTAE